MITIINSIKLLKRTFNENIPSKIILVSSGFLFSKLNWAVKEIKELTSSEIKVVEVPDGEKAKEWDVLNKLLAALIETKADKKSLIIALGGGSITDLVGFACSVYQRGIQYINVPTTLLGQVDSAIGGKTAINFLGYKNQIGSFYEPIAIVIENRFLKTLNKKQITDGLAEIIKAGLIKDPKILNIIKSHNLEKLKKGSVIKGLICRSIAVKEYFVKNDPKDENIRQILNFGHTIGHALELKYELSHGQAVLIGMIEELKLGEKLGRTNPDVRIYLNKTIERLNINLNSKELKIDWKSILHDKKIIGNKINLPIVKKLGEAELIKINLDELTPLIK